jgi:RNA polymerase sigma-70 factor, ECF subfamily
LTRPGIDEAELLRVYHATVRPLYAYVSRRVGGDRALAEDLVQETWMRALETWPAKGWPDEPLAWLTRVAHNTLVSHFRRVRPVSMDPESIDLEAPEFRPEDAATAAVVGLGMAKLRRSHADVLEAFYFDGKSTRDIAREQSTSERAVEGRLRRARAKLKKALSRILRPPESTDSRIKEGRTDHAQQP